MPNRPPTHAARISAHVSRQGARLAANLDKRYEKSPVVFSAVSAGHNQVQIDGKLYPAEGVDGQGGALSVINIGTPAVAKYAPPNRASVIAISGSGGGGGGSGGGGGGSGASNLDALTDVSLGSPSSGQVLAYNSTTGQWSNANASSGIPNPHGLSSDFHSGKLVWDKIDFVTDGSNLADIQTRLHANLQGIGPNDHHMQLHVLATGTALGADHSIANAADGQTLRASSATTAAFAYLKHTDLDPASILPNQHHAQAHEMVGTDHYDTGLTSGYTIRAFSPTGFQWDQLQHDDLGGVHPDQHHHRSHDIITGDADNGTLGPVHTVAGPQWSLPGAVYDNVLGLIMPSADPGPNAAVLRTDAYGGLRLDTNLFYADAQVNMVGINIVPGAALDIQAAATSHVTQRIKQIPNQTGRLWRVEDKDGFELIVLNSIGDLQSGHPGFVSGLTGWQITHGGNAEFNNIWARGELHATIFVKDEVHATGGTFMVATAGVLHDDATIDSSGTDDDELWVKSTAVGTVPLNVRTTSSSFTGNTLHVSGIRNEIHVNDPPSGPGLYFQPGEILRVKTEIEKPVPPSTLRLADVWLEVMYATQDDGFSRYSVVKRSGSDCTIPKGTAIISYGLPGDGRILMTSDWRKDEGYPPYLDVFTTGHAPWNGDEDPDGIVPRLRLGQLKGVGVQGVSGISQYGLIASDNLSNTNAGYIIASNLQLGLYRVPLRVNDGTHDTGIWTPDGNLRMGKDVAFDASTSFEVVTTGTHAGDVWIGDRTNSTDPAYLHWDQVNHTLYVRGDLVVGGGGGTGYVTLIDAQEMDATVLSTANLHSDGVGTTVTNNANSLRVLKVMGTWTPGLNLLSWGTLTLYLANGTSRTIAAKSGQVVSVTSYLYADLTGTGTITMVVQTTGVMIPSPSHVLIAIAHPGNAAAPTNQRYTTVTVVAGTTLISGGNIITGSIVADNLAADSVTANAIKAGAVDATKITADIYTTASSRLLSLVDGVFRTYTVGDGSGHAANFVDWTGLRILKADQTPMTIANGSAASLVMGQTYFYVLPTDPSGAAMRVLPDTSYSSMPESALIIAVATYNAGARSTTVVMTVGGVVISGDNIKADTIVAAHIVAGQINFGHMAGNSVDTAQLVAGAVTDLKLDETAFTAMGDRRILAVSGAFHAHATGANAVTWDALVVKKAGGTTVNVNASSTSGVFISARTYFFVDDKATGTFTFSPQTSLTNVPAKSILIAVVDPGPASGKVSITMVNGGTYISGDSIVTGSIITENIKAGEINASIVNADVFLASGSYRVNAVSDTFTIDMVNTPHLITWTTTTVRRGDGVSVSVNLGSYNAAGLALGAHTYLAIPGNSAGPVTMTPYTSVGAVPVGYMVVAVVERGANGSSYRTVAGGTLITGDNIVTGTIVAANIKALTIDATRIAAGAVTAAKITVDGNINITGAGELTIGNSGSIHSATKASYALAGATGFFLGWDAGRNGYTFDIGNDNNYLRWNGANLVIKATIPLDLTGDATNTIFKFSAIDGTNAVMTFDKNNSGYIEFSQPVRALNLTAAGVIKIDSVQYSGGDVLLFVVPGSTNPGQDAMRYERGGGGNPISGITGILPSLLTYTGAARYQGLVMAPEMFVLGRSFTITQGGSGSTPANSSAPGEAGEIRWDDGFLYLRNNNGWRRIPTGNAF